MASAQQNQFGKIAQQKLILCAEQIKQNNLQDIGIHSNRDKRNCRKSIMIVNTFLQLAQRYKCL